MYQRIIAGCLGSWLILLAPGAGDVGASLVLSERFDAARRFRDSSKKEAGRQLASLP